VFLTQEPDLLNTTTIGATDIYELILRHLLVSRTNS